VDAVGNQQLFSNFMEEREIPHADEDDDKASAENYHASAGALNLGAELSIEFFCADAKGQYIVTSRQIKKFPNARVPESSQLVLQGSLPKPKSAWSAQIGRMAKPIRLDFAGSVDNGLTFSIPLRATLTRS
jgi:hypothetical protein